MYEPIMLAISVFASSIVGLFVYLRNPRQLTSKIYFLLTILIVVFSISNYLSLNSDHQLLYVRLVMFSSTVIAASLYYLIVFLDNPNPRRYLSKLKYIGISFTIIVAILDFTPLVFNKFNTADGSTPSPGIGIILYFAQLILFLGLSVFLLIKRINENSREKRLQYVYLLVGVTPILLLAPITGFIMPVLFKNAILIPLSPYYGTFFVAMVGYAIVKHRLFDIRPFVARAAGYLLSIFAVGIIYGLLAFVVINNLLFSTTSLSFYQQFLYALLAVAIGFTLQPLKQFFDRFSDHIFYRDAYDPQEVLNKLNAQLVKSNSIDELAKASIDIIQDNIHPQFACFVFLDSPDSFTYYYGSKKVKLSYIEERHLATFVMNDNLRTIVADEVVQDHHIAAKKIFNKHQIALSTKLIAGDEVIGFELLGDRKSGNAFNGRDIQLLETAADSIAIAAQNALRYKEIAEFNITLQKRIEDATHQLQKSNAKLLALDDAKDEFISMASHQLRTPLTSIKGYISMLLEGDGGRLNELQHKFLDQAFISSQRMVYLIADLLNVSRVKTGKFVIEPKPTYLPDVVTSELSQLTETAKARELKLVFAKPPANFPILNLDETKIRQVIMNFADNAIYYTPKGGTISVALGLTDESVECMVTDTGIGVPKNDQHHLFTKFYRAGNARKARPDGTGLGLFMAKKVIAAQGGTIIFKSIEGKGSTFGFSFPRARLELTNQQTDIKA